MKRDFKFSSVLILQLIMIVIVFIITRLLATNPTEIEGMASSLKGIFSSLLRFIVITIFQFMIARGLVYNRMGSVGEYMDGINRLDLKIIGVLFVIDIIPNLLVLLFVYGVAATITADFVAYSNFDAVLPIAGLGLLMLIGWIIYQAFTHYRYLLAADREDLSFADLFKEIFRTGKDLFGKTIKVYLKRLILPIIVFVVLEVLLVTYGNGFLSVFLLIILPIIFVVYIFIAIIQVLAELSDYYLDYKDNHPKTQEKVVYEP